MNLTLRIVSGETAEEHTLAYSVDMDGSASVIAATIRAVADALDPPRPPHRPTRGPGGDNPTYGPGPFPMPPRPKIT